MDYRQTLTLSSTIAEEARRRLNEAADVRQEGGLRFRDFIKRAKRDYVFHKHCEAGIEVLQAVSDGELKRVMFFQPPRSGKLLADSTPVMTPEGWVLHGDLKVGDFVYHPSGRPIKVLAVSEKDIADREVVLSDDSVIKCHANHEWKVWDRSDNGWKIVSTSYFTEVNNRGRVRPLMDGVRYRYLLPTADALYNDPVDLPLDPYTLGTWLGDGSARKPCITHSPSDVEHIESISDNYKVSTVCTHGGTGVLTTYFGHSGLTQDLREAGVFEEKHVPDIYRRASIGQRLELLAGLIDSDGTTDPTGRVLISNVNVRLISGAYEIAQTLGFRPYLTATPPTTSTSGIVGRQYVYTLGFQPTMPIPTRIPRKRVTRFADQRRVSITDVRLSDSPEIGHCIQVDSPDGLYLAGEKMAVTHNSELVSRLFPAYYLTEHPDKFAALCSFNANLAYTLSRNARAYYTHAGGALLGDAKAVSQWETTKGGGFWAAGIGGTATGKGFDVGVIDDPLKDAEAAQSQTILDKQWDWYQSTFYTRRQSSNAAIIQTLTRWSRDDIAGRSLKMEESLDSPENWYIVNFEAIKTTSSFGFPDTTRLHPDWREEGEALCPEKQSIDELIAIREKTGSFWFSALYQQNPSSKEGNLWKREYFVEREDNKIVLYDTLPTGDGGALKVHSKGYDWDTAYTADEKNAANAYILSYADDEGGVYIDDFDFRWCETPDLVKWMMELVGPHYIEKKASGKSAKQFLDREGIYAIEVDVEGGDKIARTRNSLPIAEAGKLYIRRSIIDRLLDDDRQGILGFPESKYKDVNDALTQAIFRHVGSPVTGLSAQWSF